jgi:hypothetical protein
MVTNDNPWVHRGGDCNSGVLAGQLRFAVTTGGVDNYATSRLVLAN